MFKRIRLFGFGFIAGILILSIGPENRLKKTFLSYISYFNMSKRVHYHILKTDIVLESNLKNKYEINEVIKAIKISKINFKKSNTDLEECKYYLLETKLNFQDSEIEIKYCEKEKKSFVSKIEKSFY
tara:strand:- start:1713 stop:2093 length:381 start_codon:yes stop_codon:yes gene_type:complete